MRNGIANELQTKGKTWSIDWQNKRKEYQRFDKCKM